jgi:hypothetical protein
MVVGMREPLALVERSAEGRPVIASAEVVPCPPEKKRLDDEAVAAKKFVEVPNVPANDWKVDDPEAKRLLATKTPARLLRKKQVKLLQRRQPREMKKKADSSVLLPN